MAPALGDDIRSLAHALTLTYTVHLLCAPGLLPPHREDCIAIKSGWAPWAVWHEGQREGYSVPSNNITIRDMECTTQSGAFSSVHARLLRCVCGLLYERPLRRMCADPP